MSKNLVFVETSGFAFQQFAPHTVPLMQRYAERCGADFLYDQKEKKSKYPLFGKYKVYDLLDNYDRVLFLDVDILVRPDSPNLFQIVPEGHFAAFNEGAWCNDQELLVRQEYIMAVAKAFALDCSNFDMAFDYFNAGVFLAEKSHKELFCMPDENPMMREVTSEQNLLNLRIKAHKVKTYHLPICFNAMPWKWSRWYVYDSYFIHHAGGPLQGRVETVRRDHDYICRVFG